MRTDLLGPFLRLARAGWGAADIYPSLFRFVLKNLLPTAMVTIGFPITGNHGDLLFPHASIGAFFPEIVPLKLLGRYVSMRQEHGFAISKSRQAQRQVPHAKAVFIVDGPQRKRRRINGARALRKMLFVILTWTISGSSFSTLAMLKSSPSMME